VHKMVHTTVVLCPSNTHVVRMCALVVTYLTTRTCTVKVLYVLESTIGTDSAHVLSYATLVTLTTLQAVQHGTPVQVLT
jgi:hypothetical protein